MQARTLCALPRHICAPATLPHALCWCKPWNLPAWLPAGSQAGGKVHKLTAAGVRLARAPRLSLACAKSFDCKLRGTDGRRSRRDPPFLPTRTVEPLPRCRRCAYEYRVPELCGGGCLAACVQRRGRLIAQYLMGMPRCGLAAFGGGCLSLNLAPSLSCPSMSSTHTSSRLWPRGRY